MRQWHEHLVGLTKDYERAVAEAPDAWDEVRSADYMGEQDHCAQVIALHANLYAIYEHAAKHPWEAVPQAAEPIPDVENQPIVRHILANPPPLEPISLTPR
jgi:hypothetical protein